MIRINRAVRVVIVIAALILLVLVYVAQEFSYAEFLFPATAVSPGLKFVIDRTARLLINDLLCISLVYALYQNKQYVRIAMYIFLFELLVVLPIYFLLKLSLEGPSEISSPLLSPIHRMVVNPLSMIVLMAAFYYQQYFSKKEH